MKPKHTPGPWRVDKAFRDEIQVRAVPNDENICARMKVPGEIKQAEANARLIAAAPEMLEALKRWMDIHGDDCLNGIDERKHECIHCATKAAIAKAEGK